ncbi:MAG: CoA pyrophosphatase [Anaerolineae bacterium]|jgi:8-oxo-dGTP pyrophosphatase MutT (NUDIX family)|nr:CoA pyrophosphatase [Anaerolineae bacterium]MDH7474413.1 CoA pyrophosphatase [Anaerolineae bacterium]
MNKRANDWQVTIEKLRRALAGPKPGWAVQKLMAPHPRPTLADFGPGHRPRQGSVLILLCPSSGDLVLPLTRRTETVEYHKGQISLPGGARENDEPLQWTALRETQEELGIDPYTVEVLGDLTPLYIPTSDYCVYPFVAFCPVHPTWHPDPVEVAEVLEMPLSLLRDPATVHHEVWETSGLMVNVPFYLAGRHKVWGATAMILNELVFIMDNLD